MKYLPEYFTILHHTLVKMTVKAPIITEIHLTEVPINGSPTYQKAFCVNLVKENSPLYHEAFSLNLSTKGPRKNVPLDDIIFK